jgi:hypothetical protein
MSGFTTLPSRLVDLGKKDTSQDYEKARIEPQRVDRYIQQLMDSLS